MANNELIKAIVSIKADLVDAYRYAERGELSQAEDPYNRATDKLNQLITDAQQVVEGGPVQVNGHPMAEARETEVQAEAEAGSTTDLTIRLRLVVG